MNCAKTKAAMKPPQMLPQAATDEERVIGPEGQADRRMHVVLQHQQAGAEAGERAAEAPRSRRRCAPGSRPSAA